MKPIAERLIAARNDALSAGHKPAVARISPLDMKELDRWIELQNRPYHSGIKAQQTLSKDNLFGLKVVEDAKVRDVFVLEMKK